MELLNHLLKKPVWVLLIMLTATLIMGLGIPRIEMRNNFDGELPEADPIVSDLEKLEAEFDKGATLLIGIEAENIYNPSTLQKVADLSDALAEVPYILPTGISSLSTLNNVKTRNWGLDVGAFMKETPSDSEALALLRQDVRENDLVLGKFVSEDETLTVIAANLEEGFDGGALFTAVEALVRPYEGPEKIHLSGAPLMVEDVQRGISGDSRRFIPIALVIIFVGFFLCFRTPRGTFLPILVVVLSIIWTMGFMGYLGLPLTVVSNALPVVMVAVASSYGIHLMFAYYEKANRYDDREEVLRQTLKKVGAPILITGVTSAVGSASLLIFKIISLREFGVIGAAGFCFATLICLTVLPAILSLLPLSKGKLYKSRLLSEFVNRITAWAYHRNRAVIGMGVLVLPVLVYFAAQVKIGDNYEKFFPKSHPGRQASETFNERLSGMRFLDLMVDAGEPDGIKQPTFYRGFRELQTYVESLPNVGGVYDYTDVIGQVSGAMLPDRDPQAPLSQQEISQFLMMYEMSADPGDVFALRDEAYQKAKMRVFLKTSEPADHEKIFEAIREKAPTFFTSSPVALTFGGEVMYRIALGRYIVNGKIQNIVLAVLAVLLLCAFLFRSLAKGLQTILPIAISLLTVFGLMGFLGIRLGISTALLTAMIVGIGVDFAVHYLMRYYRERETAEAPQAIRTTASTTGTAILFDSVSNVMGFAALSFSGFLPVQHFGWLLALSMLFIFLVTIVVYPCLFAVLERTTSFKLAQSEISPGPVRP